MTYQPTAYLLSTGVHHGGGMAVFYTAEESEFVKLK
ncbi:hypothetical protein EPYR_01235 [Erwinia pyrifoliae DSM 12163]|nr:hypothetical protein EPYR_01235 [Erwinia pyrifoliae DSM 12163]